MSVRKRSWVTPKGDEKTAWVVDYFDTKNVRRLKTFSKKKDADAFAANTKVEVRDGTHVADRASVTVRKAGENWIASSEAAGLERSTVAQYQRHLDFHIAPKEGEERFLADVLLSKLTVPVVREFEDDLRKAGRSAAMIKKVIGSLGAILADAQERGHATRNPVRDIRVRRKGKQRRAEKRQNGKLKVGVDIPTPAEIKAIVAALEGRWRPILLTAIFSGLRSSELRGLRWQDVNLEARTISVHQRVDEFGEIGPPKSEAGERTVKVPPIVINALREWRLACPRRKTGRTDDNGRDVTELHYVFPNGAGNPESHGNVINRGLIPAMVKAGVSVPKLDREGNIVRDKDGKAVMTGKYTGLHALRHFYASWLMNRPQNGGLGLPLKDVQERMGHSSIVMTADTYGHLFQGEDNGDELATAEAALLG